jgi:5-methyltetrahydrofolate--homocysteine methyltransferase
MKPDKLILVGEKINYSISRVGRLLDASNYRPLQKIAKGQEDHGADYIDINVGTLTPQVMEETVRAVQEAVSVPLCLDSADPAILTRGIESYDDSRSNGLPILNSAIEANAQEVLALRHRRPCQVVLLVSERVSGSSLEPNLTPEDSVETARRLFSRARAHGFEPDEIYFDPGTPALAGDLTGRVNTALSAIEMVHSDSDFAHCHILVGLSNLTAGLPRKVRLPLQNAFLTTAMQNGLDCMIGDPSKDYRRLDDDDPYLGWLNRILSHNATDRLTELTSSHLYKEAAASEKRKSSGGGAIPGTNPES